MAVRLSDLGAGGPLTPARIRMLTSVKGWVDPRATVRLEELGPLKIQLPHQDLFDVLSSHLLERLKKTRKVCLNGWRPGRDSNGALHEYKSETLLKNPATATMDSTTSTSWGITQCNSSSQANQRKSKSKKEVKRNQALLSFFLLTSWLADFRPWRWRWCVPPKRRWTPPTRWEHPQMSEGSPLQAIYSQHRIYNAKMCMCCSFLTTALLHSLKETLFSNETTARHI
jgi:hypothetical protein